MNNQPLISVIMNCYNGEKYLKKSIESVLSQEYKNWELIFWDNLSTDKSKEILLSYKDKRIKYFKSKNFLKLYHARHEAIKVSNGEIISFLDCDDWWLNEKLKEQIKYFENDKVGLVYSNFYFFNEKTKKIKKFKRNLFSGNISNKLLDNFFIGILTTLIRKKAYYDVNGFNKKYDIIGDFDLNIKLSKKWEFVGVNKILANYRVHGQNLSIKNNDKHIEEFEEWIKENKNNFNLNKLENYLNYLKTLRIIKNEKIIVAFLNIFKVNSFFFKIKLFFILILKPFLKLD